MKRDGEPRDYSLLDALIQERIEQAGGNRRYAVQLGIGNSSIWRWTRGEYDLFTDKTGDEKQLLFDDLGFKKPELEQLAKIPVTEACILVLETESEELIGEIEGQHPGQLALLT